MDNVLALIAATVILILIPGPNVALIVANSLRYGMPIGIMTSLGTTLGIAVQLLISVLGLSVLIEWVADALNWIRWLGVAYLLFVGLRTFSAPAEDLSGVRAQTSTRAFWRGTLLAIVNPKTLLFNAAFLPQFLGQGPDTGNELIILAAVFLTVIVIGDALWAVFAGYARHWLGRYGRWHNRISGGFLITAGIGLALARRGD